MFRPTPRIIMVVRSQNRYRDAKINQGTEKPLELEKLTPSAPALAPARYSSTTSGGTNKLRQTSRINSIQEITLSIVYLLAHSSYMNGPMHYTHVTWKYMYKTISRSRDCFFFLFSLLPSIFSTPIKQKYDDAGTL